ncbi:hypothetical protein RJ639_037868 [Escallonia herrerae]|uniref:Cytochrome c oxidase assembly factor 5 n=1 Tax=Escallonia herrerae TaxID=1293975 RepID=A0AA88WZA2_9ASTE|nr:hypothetical protein RJ639_037868 [Escallonia herrerae]
MAKSCKGLAMELVKCLNESDCVQVDKRSYRECAKEKSPSISSECVGLRETYFNCKRGQVRLKYEGDENPSRVSSSLSLGEALLATVRSRWSDGCA